LRRGRTRRARRRDERTLSGCEGVESVNELGFEKSLVVERREEKERTDLCDHLRVRRSVRRLSAQLCELVQLRRREASAGVLHRSSEIRGVQ